MGCRNEKPLEVLESGQPVWARNAKGKPICNSVLPRRNNRIRKPNQRCQVSVGLFPNGRCEDHGGPAISGPEHPAFVHGKTSKYGSVLTGKFKELYEEELTSKDVLSLTNDVALTSGRVKMLLADYRDLDSKVFSRLMEQVNGTEELLAGEYDETEIEEALREIIKTANRLDKQYQQGRELERTQEHLRRLVDTESKRLQGERESLSAAQAFALMGMFQESILGHLRTFILFLRDYHPDVIKDPRRPDLQKAILTDITRIMPKALPEVTITRKGKEEE